MRKSLAEKQSISQYSLAIMTMPNTITVMKMRFIPDRRDVTRTYAKGTES